MVIGDTGLAGHPAASHVAQEQDLALEAVAVLPLLVVEQAVLDQAQTQKTVTHNVAQVEVETSPNKAQLQRSILCNKISLHLHS